MHVRKKAAEKVNLSKNMKVIEYIFILMVFDFLH